MLRPAFNRTSRRSLALLIGSAAALALGCAPTQKGTSRGKVAAPISVARPVTQSAPVVEVRPLFDRLGGTAGVTKVVDDFVASAAADPKVNFTRAGQPHPWDATPEHVALLKKRLVEFIATATGGDLAYNGTDMVTAHRGMNITDAEFDALAADLKGALEKHAVPAREQAELLAVVNRTRSAIVVDAELQKKAAATASSAPNVLAAKPAEPPKAPSVAEKPAPPFVPQPVTSDETELEEEPAAAKEPNK